MAPRSECKRGHAMEGDNLYVAPSGMRQCRACMSLRSRARYAENRQKIIDRSAARRAANPDRTEENRRRYARHPEKVNAANARWRAANPERVRDMRENRRARERAAFVEDVDRTIVWALRLGLCGVCHAPVAQEVMELDHIVPLSRGGTHQYSNCQPAHMICNRRKHNKVVT